MSRYFVLTLAVMLLLFHGASSATLPPAADAAPGPQPYSIPMDARIEIVWPHDNAPVQQATLANITAYVFKGNTRVPIRCDVAYTVRLWVALNNEPAQPVAVGARRITILNGYTVPVWDFNDVDVSAARNAANKLAFFLTVDRENASSNIWSHAADARTYLPQPLQPTGVVGLFHRVDTRIQLVWPHDDGGRAQPTERATRANVTVALFDPGATTSVSPYDNPQVELFRAVNNEGMVSVGYGEKRLVTTDVGLTYPVWDFNDVDVQAARDSRNKVYFRAEVKTYETYSSVWSHAADARTYLPNPDLPTGSCEGAPDLPPATPTSPAPAPSATPQSSTVVRQFLVGPGSPGRLYAVLADSSAQNWRFIVSDDYGQSWQPFAGGLPPERHSISLDYAAPDAVYSAGDSGLYRWTGSAWQKLTAQSMHGLAIRYGDPSQMWAIATIDRADRVIFSSDGGHTWAYGTGPLNTPTGLALDPHDSNIIYALTAFKGWWFSLSRASADLGLPAAQRKWDPLPVPGAKSAAETTIVNVQGMTIDGATGAIYLAVATAPALSPTGVVNQIWRMPNPREPNIGDARWELAHDFGPYTTIRLVASGWSPRGLALYATIAPIAICEGGNCPDKPPEVLHRSLDGGQTWSPLPLP